MYPISINKNNYNENRKESSIDTPLWLATYIYHILPEIYQKTLILDVGIGKGNLSYLFDNVVGVDIEYKMENNIEQIFIEMNFLKLKKWGHKEPGLVTCNPPFNDRTGEFKKKLLPELFFRKIIELFGPNMPIILFTPMGFLKNQRIKSKRYKYIRDCGAEITSILSLPIDTFSDVLFHSEVIFFNIHGMKAHYFIT